MYDVIALGELLIDFTCLSTDADGYPVMAAHPGGAPANFLAALSKYGAKTALIGKVGADAFGDLLISTLKKAGIETCGLVSSEDVFTTLAFVLLDETGNREFSFSRKPGADTRLSLDEVKLDLVDQTKVLHFGTLSLTDEPARSTTYKLIEYAKAQGKGISFDPNLRIPLWKDLNEAKKQITWGLNKADIVKISDDEVAFMWGLGAQEGAEYLLEHFHVKLVFVTCGARGCYFNNGRVSGFVPSLDHVRVSDTTGAGDIFFGSAMWKLLRTDEPPEMLSEAGLREIVMFANTAAGLSTTKQGGIFSVPQYSEIEQEMEKQYHILRL